MRHVGALTLAVFVSIISGCGGSPAGGDGTAGTDPTAPATPVQHGELTRAVARGEESLVQELLLRGADVNETVGDGDQQVTPLLVAVGLGHKRLAEILVVRGAKLSGMYQGYTAQDFLYYLGNEDVIALGSR